MARTNGDLDYDNWVLFFTGHGASGGGSDLDQGDTRRDFLAHDIGAFVQDDWRIGRGPDAERRAPLRRVRQLHRADRPHRQLLPARRRRAARASSPASRCRAMRRSSSPASRRCRSASSSLPGTPIDLSQIHAAKYDSTISGDYNNVAPRVGFAWQPPFAPKRRRARRLGHLLRAHRRELQARPAALGAVLLLPERPVAAEHGRPVSAAQRQPVRDPAQRPDRA